MATATNRSKKQTGPRGGRTPGKSLCEGCLWDCVQPLGTTIVCPAYRPRREGQPRQPRQGQQRFGFDADDQPAKRETASGRQVKPTSD